MHQVSKTQLYLLVVVVLAIGGMVVLFFQSTHKSFSLQGPTKPTAAVNTQSAPLPESSEGNVLGVKVDADVAEQTSEPTTSANPLRGVYVNPFAK